MMSIESLLKKTKLLSVDFNPYLFLNLVNLTA